MEATVARPLSKKPRRGLATVASIVSDGCGLIPIAAHVYIM